MERRGRSIEAMHATSTATATATIATTANQLRDLRDRSEGASQPAATTTTIINEMFGTNAGSQRRFHVAAATREQGIGHRTARHRDGTSTTTITTIIITIVITMVSGILIIMQKIINIIIVIPNIVTERLRLCRRPLPVNQSRDDLVAWMLGCSVA